MPALLFAAVLSCCILSWSHPTSEKLRFTSTLYNVSIPENSVGRTLVTSQQPMGISGTKDDVTFKITSGDPDKIFKLEAKPVGDFVFLVLRTRGGSSVLNRERKDKHVLTIKAFGGGWEATAIVYVRVLDQNDLSPIFVSPSYEATLPEDFPVYRPILRVGAEDADLGVNGEILYSLKEPSSQFAVHPYTGVVVLTDPLRYSERSVYDLTIVAQDRATGFRGGGQSSLAKVTIRVRQVNLFGPEIYVYVLHEPAVHRLGWTYAVVRVLDRDEGIHGQIEDVRIVNGDVPSMFTVVPVDETNNRTEYNVVLLSSFKEDVFSVVNLSLQVSDKGFPQRKSYKGVSIRLRSLVDSDPRFLKESYEINVPEYLPQGYPLFRLNILNEKQFLSNKFSIKIEEGNIDDTFRVYSRTSVFYTNKPLDSESTRVFTITLVIVDKNGNPVRVGSTAKVKVNVIDFNDNFPVFNEVPEEVWVNENQPAGSRVAEITATDKDSGDNGQVTYSIANINRIPFEIDPLSGVLRTTQPLDFEYAKHIYFIKVRASDSGIPFRLEAQKTIKVRVRDLNDNSPEFTKGECSLSIPRNLRVGSDLFSITATDLDENDIIKYSVHSSFRDDCIEIEFLKGMLSLQCDLNDISKSEWDVNITANDGVHKAYSSLRIFLVSLQVDSDENNIVQYSCRDIETLKINPKPLQFSPMLVLPHETTEYEPVSKNIENINTPTFINFPESLNIKDTLPVGEVVYNIEAFDNEEGINGRIVFGLSCKPEEFVLRIDSDNGVIYLFSEIDYQNRKQYTINVSVCDLGIHRKCSFGNIMLNVLNSKYHTPQFKESHYKVRIKEDVPVGKEVFNVKATIEESSLNRNIIYHISPNGQFTIEQNGSITLKSPLDRETAESHTITIKASNAEVSSNDTLSKTTVTFYVEDVNDENPTIENTRWTVKVPEDLPIGSVVFIVNAIDRDEGKGSELSYFIRNDFFKIDSNGVIRLGSKLDFETESEHRLDVIVSDNGIPALSTEFTVVVIVTDVDENLHAPTFEDVVLAGTVREGLPVGSAVMSVVAGDPDPAGVDSRVVYRLSGGSGMGRFSVSEQGHITTAAVLDAEQVSHYWLTVEAQDCALLPLSTTVQVYISVQDANDHLPLTLEPFYSFTVEENLPSMTVVGYVTAADDDVSAANPPTSGRRSANLIYSLASSSPITPFTIDSQTGLISTTRLMDREETPEYVFEVVVTDSGTPSLSSVTEVRVTIKDVNDHAPRFTQDHYAVKLYKPPQMPSRIHEELKGVSNEHDGWRSFSIHPKIQIHPIFQVSAVDDDEGLNGNVTYSVETDSPFTIDSKTGLIYPLTSEKPRTSYDFQVKASDDGNPKRSSIAQVSIFVGENTQTQKKVKEVNKIKVKVGESLSVGEAVMRLESLTSDQSETTYLITGGNEAACFAVVGDQLLLTRRLDSETMPTVVLDITASNLTHTWSTKVEIDVLDINEHHPRFSLSNYFLNVTEDTPVGSILTTLQAGDQDVNSSLHFSVHNFHPGSEVFRVDRATGDLVLTGQLDRELATTHLLTLRVSDSAEDARHGYARVHITVVDTNDNPPTFPADSLTLRVAEDAPTGTAVGAVVASDVDEGESGQVRYDIVSGNLNETFKINPETGDLMVNNYLDTYKVKEFQLIIRALDRGFPPLESRVIVFVSIIPSEKKMPSCTESLKWTEVPENTRVGDVVGTIDVIPLPFLNFEITSGDSEGVFSINPTTGDILLVKPLDYETTTVYNITSSVISRASLKTDCLLTIYVTDHNDNAPTFKQEAYVGKVDESVPVGTIVMADDGPLRIILEDHDTGENAMLKFLLEGNGKDLLTIDPITGTVRTAAPLDYETLTEIDLSIKVTDLGTPSLAAPTVASLKVFVKDSNDCPPRFLQRGYNATVFMPVERDVFVLQVFAEDGDTESVTRLEYSISIGNEDLALSIDQYTGEIFVEEPIKLNQRKLTVKVSDGVFEDITTVDIAVQLHHRSGLRFQKDVYHAAVMESASKPSIVAVVTLLGSFLDENIRFSILNRKRNLHFSIGSTSGIVSTVGDVFDREKQDFYNLIVQAYSIDRRLVAFTRVNVSVLDANDNCPQFANLPYHAIVARNTSKGDFVLKVSATDIDSGESGEVRYDLDPPASEMFRIGRKSGEVRVKNLGNLIKEEIVIGIKAYDGGIIPCYTPTTMLVSVVDASAPQWQRAVYKAAVAENAEMFTTINVALKATAAHKVIYHLVNCSDFVLRHDTGELQTFASLDRETHPVHHLRVRALDSVLGTSSDTLVLLEVTDVNDNPPEFQRGEYRARVGEETAVGSAVVRVEAQDRDAGNNSTIRYSLSDSHFKVDPANGTVYLQGSLDYEEKKQHILKVVATDNGVPAVSSHVYVFIEVTNANDNPPEVVASTSKFMVAEDATRGLLVGRMVAFDRDGDPIIYQATSQDRSATDTFSIDDKTGIITLINPKNLRGKNKFKINISVDDGLHSTSGFFEVNVLQRNLNLPKFNRDVYELEVDENKAAGDTLIRVAAFDKDAGNFGNISYILPPQRSSKFFSIDKYTGDIRTLGPLDRELKPYHLLDIMAKDGGGLISWTKVKVKVIDKNDNEPKFSLPHYYACLGNEETLGSEILKVSATDADGGVNGEVRYSILTAKPAEAKGWFHINPVDGSVTLISLDIMSGLGRVELKVRASDAGSPPLHRDVTASLTVSRDLPPPLRSFPSILRVPADARPDFLIHHFRPKHQKKFTLSIIGDNEYFFINESGHLILKQQLASDNITVGLLAQAFEDKTICAFYVISIQKYPSPQASLAFVQDKVELSLPENLDVGTLIYKVTTTEEDPTVLYAFALHTKVFAIDPTTGWVSLASPLDRENDEVHDVTVIASSSRNVTRLTTCDVTIVVTDVNDNPPIFSQEVYNVAVREDAPLATEVATLSLVDPDTSYDVLHYVITDGDVNAEFAVTSDGRVVVARPLDREFKSAYSLTVVATDGTFTASSLVNVVVIDVNDEPHHCIHSLYNTSVSETVTPGQLVTSMLTFDPDLEVTLSYQLTGQGHDQFYVDNHGDMRLKQYLDRETTDSYTLEVAVLDPSHPEWTCSSTVRVAVEDSNDNAPSFAIVNETIMVTEDAVVGMILTRIIVLDYDEGPNSSIRYSIVNPTGFFNLTSDTGLLSLARLLPNGPGSVYYVTVRATDQGRPPLSSQSTLQVVVLGMNDDPPVYLSGSYHVTVPEDAPVQSSLLTVPVGDVAGRTTVFTILEGNGQAEFDIDRRTGLLTTNKPLDYESHQSYQLVVLATSLGDSSTTSYFAVNVSVTDVNDNAPLFKVNTYNVKIREDIEVGQMVLKIEAVDIDSGANGMIRYSLDANSMQQFAIDSYNGMLMVLSPLDREKRSEYNISVEATDQGDPPLCSAARVAVTVVDVDDNPPVFLTPNVSAVLQADRMPGWAVFHFVVTDADVTFNSTVDFRITDGNERNMFRVDADGTLRTTDKLNIKLGDQFKLGVRVEDSTNPSMYSSTWIYIKVVEPSKHPPTLQPLRVWVGVYEHQWSGGDLGVITASDLDPWDRLEFSVANPQFSVDLRAGTFKARGELAAGVYDVAVTVTDGKFSAATSAVVTVELLRQDMLQTSVYIRLSPDIKGQTLAARLPQFLTTLQSAFLKEVKLISIQENPNSTTGLLIAVDGGADLAVVQEVMATSGLPGTTPRCDCHNGGVCQRQLQMMPESPTLLSAPGVSFVTPGHSLSYYCICSLGYAGDHCEEVKCLCPPLQVCVPQKVGFACIPPCSPSANQTCPAAMTSSVTWSELVTSLLVSTAVVTAVAVFVVFRRYRRSPADKEKYGGWSKQNCQTKKKSKLSNLLASQKPQIFTGSPNNGAIGRKNLEGVPTAVIEGEVIPLDYLRNINPISKLENVLLQGHSSAPDLAACHVTDVVVLAEDPARGLAALDDQLSQEVVQYGFPPQGALTTLPEDLEVSL